MTEAADNLMSRDDRVDAAIADWLDAEQSDNDLDEARFLAQHSDLEAELREFLDDRRQFAQLADSLGAPSGSGSASAVALTGPRTSDETIVGGQNPRQFGDYLLLDEIARGGMGVVYRASQSGLDRIVAVKLILAGQFASNDDVKRFYAEARAAAGLQHPNIVAIHEVGQQDGQHFFSMDYVAGRSLAELIRRESITPKRAVEIVRAVAAAIDCAHQQGTLHRDIKPSNILIDESGTPRITDFGLARRVAEDSELTRTGDILGTPAYMPPEQAAGRPDRAGPAGDVYSLGAVLYELLTGRPPFRAASAVETLLQVRDAEAVPPRLLNPSVSVDLNTICLKCLEKDPRRRYASAGNLLSDLERLLNDEPIAARPISPVERAFRWCRRNPSLAALCGVLLIAGAAVFSQWIRAELNAVQAAINSQLYQEAASRAEEAALNEQQTREQTDQQLYIANMNLAVIAGERGNYRHLTNLLRKYAPGQPNAHLRGFEWYHLWHQVNAAGRLTIPHETAVSAVAVSPDGRWVVAADFHGLAHLYDRDSGKLIRDFAGHRKSLTCIDISPDGTTLCTGSFDRTARLWDIKTGELLSELTGHGHDVVDVRFTADGRHLVTASWDHAVHVFDVSTGEELRQFDEHTGPVLSVAITTDGTLLASSSADETVRIRSLETGETLYILRRTRVQRPYWIEFSPDGRTLAVAGSENSGTIMLYDVETGEERAQCQGHTGFCVSVAFSPDGTQLVSGSRDQSVRVWDARNGEQLQVFRGHAGHVLNVDFVPDGTAVISASRDGLAREWSLASEDESTVHLGSGVLTAAWSPDGQRVAAGTWKEDVLLVDPETEAITDRLTGHAGAVFQVAYSPDGTRLASGSRDTTVRLWDPGTGEQLHVWTEHEAEVRSLTFSHDGRLLASGDRAGQVIVRDVSTGDVRYDYEHPSHDGQANSVNALTFTPDDTRILSAARHLRWFDCATGEVSMTSAHLSTVRCVAFSSAGNLLASGSRDETARLWSYPEMRIQHILRGHSNNLSAVAFVDQGRTLVTASNDETIRLWDVASGLERARLQGHSETIHCLAVSPDGRTLVSGANDRRLKFWRTTQDQDVASLHLETAY